MKPKTIIYVVISLFLIASIFGGIKSCQVRKLATEKATLKAEFNNLQKQKEVSEFKLKALNAELTTLQTDKQVLITELIKYKAETNKLIDGFKNVISEYKKLPVDTIYLKLYSKWPTYDQVLKFRFAENQVREIYLNVLERDHYLNLYEKTGKSLLTCTDLNVKNNEIIGNLTGQNDNLQTQVDLSELQIVNLQDNLQLSDKALNKQKRKTFFYKLTTVAGIVGITYFAIK